MDNSSQIPQQAPMSLEQLNASLPIDPSVPQMPPLNASQPPVVVPEVSIANELQQGTNLAKDWLTSPAAGGPSVLPPQVPVKEEVVLPQPEFPQAKEQVRQAITPTTLEVQQSLQTQSAPVRKVIADATAKNMANTELSKFIKSEQENQTKLEQSMKMLEDRTASEVRTKSLPEIMQQGTFGQKFMAALAVGLGAGHMALTGAKENPALRMINSAVEQQAAKDKLNFDQKAMLKKQLIESSQNLIQAAQAKFSNEITQQKLQMEYDKLEAERQATMLKMQASYQDQAALDVLTNSQLQSTIEPQGSPEEVAAIKAHNNAVNRAFQVYAQQDPKKAQDLMEKKVTLPNGQIVISPANVGQVNKFGEMRADIEGAKKMVDKIISAASSGSKLDPRDRAEMLSNIIALTGRLRLAYLGPGAMTQQEYDRLYKAIGDPSNILTLDAIELAKLNAVKDNLDVDLAERAKSTAGLKWPVSKRAQIISQFRARGASPREAAERADKLMQKLSGE